MLRPHRFSTSTTALVVALHLVAAAAVPRSAAAQAVSAEDEEDFEVVIEVDSSQEDGPAREPAPAPTAEPAEDPRESTGAPGAEVVPVVPDDEGVVGRSPDAGRSGVDAAGRVAAPDAARGPPERAASRLEVSAYVQAQYTWSALSEDEVLQGGEFLNQNRFAIRRGRIRLAGEWEHFAAEFELDGSTTSGPFVGLRRTTVSVLARGEDALAPPIVEVAVGLTEVPFGHEVRASQRDWPFMERSLGSLAFFPGPLDLGVRVTGGLGPYRFDVAVMGGTPLDDRAGQRLELDPTSAPDVVGRLGIEPDAGASVELAMGTSFLWGTGFHAGQQATKGRLEWRDLNENGALELGETIAVPGTAATPSTTFERWAVGLDARAGFETPIGWTRALAEIALASNLDRGLFVADPVVTGYDLRALSAYVAVVQDLGRWASVGVRYDLYDPDSDLIDQRRGVSVPADAAIHTVSPMAALRLPPEVAPGFGGRIVLQYDAIFDALARDANGLPTDLRNDRFIVRVQGELQ